MGAARAHATVDLDPRDARLDLGNVDFVVSLAQFLIGFAQSAAAMFARLGHDAHDLVGVLGQRPVHAFAPNAAGPRPRPFRLVGVGFALVRLEPLRRRYARIAAVLRRLVQPRFKLRNAPLLFIKAFDKHKDQGLHVLAAHSVKIRQRSHP